MYERYPEPVVSLCPSRYIGVDLPYDCLTGDTEIVTDEGPKRISRIKPLDNVLTHKGYFRTVARALQRDYQGPLLAIELEFGCRFRITPEHKVYVWSERYYPARRGHPELRAAGLLERGDLLYSPTRAKTCYLYRVSNVTTLAYRGKVHDLLLVDQGTYVIHKGPAVRGRNMQDLRHTSPGKETWGDKAEM